MGVLPSEGVGVEKFVLSLESLSSLLFEASNLGCPGPLGVFKEVAQRKFVMRAQNAAFNNAF